MSYTKFLDYDKNKKIFYYNIYAREEKIVIKVPFSKNRKLKQHKKIKIEKFDLTKYTFLLNCENKKCCR